MKRSTRVLFLGIAIGAILGLTGCKMEMQTNLYLSALRKAQINENPLNLESKIRFQVLSKEYFKQEETSIRSLLNRYFGGIKGLRCEERGMEFYATARTDMALVLSSDHSQSGMFWLRLGQQDDGMGLEFMIDRRRFDQFASEVETQLGDAVVIENLIVKMNIINDEKEPSQISVFSSYIDGRPTAGWQLQTLGIRQSIEVKLSEVATSKVMENGNLLFLKFAAAGEGKSIKIKTGRSKKDNSMGGLFNKYMKKTD